MSLGTHAPRHILVRHMLEHVTGHVLWHLHLPARHVPDHVLVHSLKHVPQNRFLEPSSHNPVNLPLMLITLWIHEEGKQGEWFFLITTAPRPSTKEFHYFHNGRLTQRSLPGLQRSRRPGVGSWGR